MKVLFVQRFDIENVSCARRAVALAARLDRLGHPVTLVNFPHAERRSRLPDLKPALPESVEVIDLPRRGTAMLRNIRTLCSFAARSDVIHLWKSYPDISIPTLRAAFAADRPVHYDWDDWETDIASELTGSRLVSHLVGRFERWVPGLVDTVSVASAELRTKAVEWGVAEDRIWDAPVGVNPDLFSPIDKPQLAELAAELWPGRPFPDPASPVLVYVGQLEVAFFARECLDVLSRLKDGNARLLIIGGGRRLPEVKNTASAMGLTGRVCFTGYVPADLVPRYLSLGDVALAPFTDSMVARCKSPLKVLEYMACGLPVVGARVGEVPRMVGEFGEMVSPGDVGGMAAAVERVLENISGREGPAAAARRRLKEQYSWRNTALALVEAYGAARGIHARC